MTETKPLFPKPLSQWLSENRFEFERTATVSCLPRVEGMNVITPTSPITYVDSQGLMTALARYEKYVDEHFNL